MFNRPSLTYRRLLVLLTFGVLVMIPTTLSAWIFIEAGIKPDVAVYITGLCVPALLVPALPEKYRKAVETSGWPARVAFGGPAILTGIFLMQLSILEIGRGPWTSVLLMIVFGFLLMARGLFLIVPDR